MKLLFRNVLHLSGIYAIGEIAQNALKLLLVPLYTYILSPEDFGILALMTLSVSLLTCLISSPIGSAFVRFYYKPDYTSQNGLLLFNLFLLLLLQTFLLSITYWCTSSMICRLLFSDMDMILVVHLYTYILFFTPVSNYFLSLVQMKRMASFYVVLSLTQFILSLAVITYGLLILEIGIYAPILGSIVSLMVPTIAIFPIFCKLATFKLSLSIIKKPLKFGYPQILSGYSNLIIQSGDRYVLRFFNSIGDVGLYSFGYTFSSIINILIVTPIKKGLYPIIFRLEKNPVEQKRFLGSAATHFYLISMFVAISLSLFAKEVIMLLAWNGEFWPSWVIVPIITFAYVQHGLGNFIGWGIVMKNKAFHISKNLLISASINMGLNFVFIPLWGILGAAFATLVSYVVWNGLKIYYSAKFYDLHFDIWRLGNITAVGVGLYLMSLFISNTDSIALNLGIKFLILLSYPFVFIATGFFKDNELDYMRQLWGSVRKKGIRETYVRIRAM